MDNFERSYRSNPIKGFEQAPSPEHKQLQVAAWRRGGGSERGAFCG